MRKIIGLLVFIFSVAAVAQAQQTYTGLDPAEKEELKRSYRQAVQDAKKLTQEFKNLYGDMKDIVGEETFGDFYDEDEDEDEEAEDAEDEDDGDAPDSFFSRTSVKNLDKEVVVTLDIPGITKKNVTLHLRDRKVLEILARRDDGPFHRKRIKLPAKVQTKGISAKLENGVLVVRLPKDPSEPLPEIHKIPVA